MSAAPGPSVITDSPLCQRNPTIKLALLFLASAAMLFVFDPVTPAVLYLLALTAVLLAARIPWRVLALAHIPFTGFALGLLTINALSRPGEVVWDAIGLRVTAEGITIGASLALRTLVIGVLSIAFAATTEGIRLMTSLQQHARLSPRVTYAVLAGYRMLQDMPREWQIIRQAHAVRAPQRPDGRLPSHARDFGKAAFSLLVVSLRKGERMAQSLESRGLGLSPRTTWRPVALERADWLMAVTVVAVLVLVPAAGTALGYLEGYKALFR